MEGWIKLHRSLLESDFWKCESFSRGQAWVDLLMLANFKDSFFYKRGVKVDVKRGQLGRSEVELSDRWKWSRSKVRKFLKDLEKEQQIKVVKTSVTQVVTILKYDDFQTEEQQKDSRRTAEGQQKDSRKTHIKNDKKEKNEEKEEEYYYIIDEKLKLSFKDYEKLLKTYSPSEVDAKIFELENYDPKKRSKYKSMYLTLNRFLLKDRKQQEEKQAKKEEPKEKEYKYIRDHF